MNFILLLPCDIWHFTLNNFIKLQLLREYRSSSHVVTVYHLVETYDSFLFYIIDKSRMVHDKVIHGIEYFLRQVLSVIFHSSYTRGTTIKIGH